MIVKCIDDISRASKELTKEVRDKELQRYFGIKSRFDKR